MYGGGPYPRRQPISRDVQRRVFERDGFACLYCGSPSQLELDHIVPIRYGGRDSEDNLQTLCSTHNQEKGTYECDLRVSTIEDILVSSRRRYAH